MSSNDPCGLLSSMSSSSSSSYTVYIVIAFIFILICVMGYFMMGSSESYIVPQSKPSSFQPQSPIVQPQPQPQ